MRHIIKSFLITVAIVYIAYIIVPTIDFGPDPKNILLFLGGLWIIFVFSQIHNQNLQISNHKFQTKLKLQNLKLKL